MTKRTHLSIGEVLGLLSDDFPDLTITKIRFLESQGLIDPERTASGYRKFYDFDIERLRWILRQQRENFLPLKVIKDRLDRSEGKLPDGGSTKVAEPAQAQLAIARDPGSADPPPVWMADHAKSPRAREPEPEPTSSSSSTGDPNPEAQLDVDHSVADRSLNSHSKVEASTDRPSTTAPPTAADPGTKVESKSKSKSKTKTASGTAVDNPPTGSPATDDAPKPAPAPNPSRSEPTMPESAKPPAGTDLSDVSLTRSELLDAAKLDDRQLTQLESFGIVVPSDDVGDPIYGAEALVCARQAAIFLDVGMEPRHLRAFKVAADREAGLYEQLVLPLLRQRNPAARSEASQIVRRLSSAGATLHGALLQQSLRSQVRTRR